MNFLGIDYGTKNIGLAYSVSGIISTLDKISNNDDTFNKIIEITNQYKIDKIYVGLSEGKVAKATLKFVTKLRSMINLPIETVEEAVSTIEAIKLSQANRKSKKNLRQQIDSVAAAVILSRVIS